MTPYRLEDALYSRQPCEEKKKINLLLLQSYFLRAGDRLRPCFFRVAVRGTADAF